MKAALPEYSIRRSPKAKNIRLKVTREEGLVVVIPKEYDEKKIPELLNKKKVWIADALNRIGETKRFLEPKPEEHFPENVRLTALGELWSVTYHKAERHAGTRLKAANGLLVISGLDLSRESVILKLKEWLRGKVREDLFPIAEKLASRHQLKLRGLMVKSQRTRWASCSAKRNLALNTKLLFLSPDLVRYAIIHELCHTVHMNHGNEFWRLVATHEPGYKVLDKVLRDAWKTLPQWAF